MPVAPVLFGRWISSMPARRDRISMSNCGKLPTPTLPIAYLAGILLRIGDEFGEALGRKIRVVATMKAGTSATRATGVDVAVVVDGELLGVENRRDHVGVVVAEHQRVAVGPRTRHVLDREDAVGAGLVLDHEGLAERLRASAR